MIGPFMLHWNVISKILLNTILVSIPEEIYLVMLTLILIGEFDYWMEDECKKLINRWDYPRILIPVLPVALLSNVARYTGINMTMASIACLVVFYILIVLTNDILNDAKPLKWMGKALISLMITQFTIGISELIYLPSVLYITNKTLTQINNDLLLNFLASLPSRLIQFTALAYLISRKRTLLKGNIIKYVVTSGPILFAASIWVIASNFAFILIINWLVTKEEVFVNIPYAMQITVIIGFSIFPILNISTLIGGVYYVKNKDMLVAKNAHDELTNLSKSIKIYTNTEDYGNIKWKLNEIEMAINKVAENLYTQNDKVKKGG